jgi:hypothetical protein
MSREETFLSRWSRRKTEAREPEDLLKEELPEAELVDEQVPSPSEDAVEPSELGSEEAEETTELPDIESLTKDSDYSAFMRPDVDPGIRKRALSKLWRSDPVYANVDGLNDYDGDFRNPAVVGAAVRTVYNVMTGYSHLLKPKEDDAEEADPGKEDSTDMSSAPDSTDVASDALPQVVNPQDK